MKSRRVRSAEARPEGGTTIVLEDGAQITVASAVYNLYATPAVRRHARGVVAPLADSGIDLLRFEDANGAEQVITSADVPAFDLLGGDEQLLDTVQRLNVTVTSLTFIEGNKWRFSDGSATFNAGIADEQFLARVRSAQEKFGHGDTLDCRIRVQQYARPDGTLATERTVLEVIQHRSAPPIEPLPI